MTFHIYSYKTMLAGRSPKAANDCLVNLKAVKLCLYDFEQGEMIERRFGSKDWIVALLYVNN